MIPIWLIIGITILVYGLAIAVTGAVRWNHPAPGVAMARLHADFWWGLFMTALGLFYVIRFRPGKDR
jgi:FtsH-binding integral membrane protein